MYIAKFKNQKPRSNTVVRNYSSDTSPCHSCRQEQPEDLPTEKPPTPVYEQQWAPNTIQTIIMICNAKGIPNAIAQKL
jgi:hypothetical protein